MEQLKTDNIAFPNALSGARYAGVSPGGKWGPNADHPSWRASAENLDNGFAALLGRYGGSISPDCEFEPGIQAVEVIGTGPTSVHHILPRYLSS